jgi:hypothetical protein
MSRSSAYTVQMLAPETGEIPPGLKRSKPRPHGFPTIGKPRFSIEFPGWELKIQKPFALFKSSITSMGLREGLTDK